MDKAVGGLAALLSLPIAWLLSRPLQIRHYSSPQPGQLSLFAIQLGRQSHALQPDGAALLMAIEVLRSDILSALFSCCYVFCHRWSSFSLVCSSYFSLLSFVIPFRCMRQ